MALAMEELMEEVGEGCFFTGNTSFIEYVLERDLDALESYGLVITREKYYFLVSNEIRSRYGEECRWDHTDAVLAGLKELSVPRPIQMDLKSEWAVYLDFFRSHGKQVINSSGRLKELSLTKTKSQLKRINSCLELNRYAYEDFKSNFKMGMSELEGKKILEESYYLHSGQDISYCKDLVSGVRTSQVSGYPTNYKPVMGDTILLDLLPRKGGIYCDTTRTFFMGEPDRKQRRIYDILLEAMAEAEYILRPGIMAKDIYGKIIHCFSRYGMEHYFPHHAGHGFGSTIYEAPYFLPGDMTRLLPGMAVTLEPGLYLPGEFGIRIENNYCITENGFEVMGEIPLLMEDYILKG